MIEYTFAHMGINCANAEEARKGAALLEALFGLTVRGGKQLRIRRQRRGADEVS